MDSRMRNDSIRSSRWWAVSSNRIPRGFSIPCNASKRKRRRRSSLNCPGSSDPPVRIWSDTNGKQNTLAARATKTSSPSEQSARVRWLKCKTQTFPPTLRDHAAIKLSKNMESNPPEQASPTASPACHAPMKAFFVSGSIRSTPTLNSFSAGSYGSKKKGASVSLAMNCDLASLWCDKMLPLPIKKFPSVFS